MNCYIAQRVHLLFEDSDRAAVVCESAADAVLALFEDVSFDEHIAAPMLLEFEKGWSTQLLDAEERVRAANRTSLGKRSRSSPVTQKLSSYVTLQVLWRPPQIKPQADDYLCAARPLRSPLAKQHLAIQASEGWPNTDFPDGDRLKTAFRPGQVLFSSYNGGLAAEQSQLLGFADCRDQVAPGNPLKTSFYAACQH